MTVEHWADAVGVQLAHIAPGAPFAERVAPMMQMALAAAAAGNYVFPLRPADKRPAIKGWQDAATREQAAIRRFWRTVPFNLLTGLADDTPAWNVTSLQSPCTPCASARFRRLHDTARRR
ncbi:bifunctional DNA primase/polymerase, partial [Nocardia ninae]|uniref:bifunctional DNA primase/polymerase n=3 Tax=Nocardia ninae TaxID=356145 RepID=UPI0039EE0E83